MTSTASTPQVAQLQRPRKKSESDAKTRVRLKPETRAQLIARLTNPQLSLYETALLLRVSRATVRRWADNDKLSCIRTAGGQRRFMWRDVHALMKRMQTT